MAQFVNIYKCDLHKGPVVTSLHQVFLGDVEANRVGVRVTDNGEDVTLTGTCSGTAILCNGGTVALTGTVDGSLAYVDLPSAVYTVEGPVEIYVTLTQGDQTTTLLTAHGNAVRTDSGVVIDPGTIIPSVAALISDIDEAVASIPEDYSELSADVVQLKSDMEDVQHAVETLEEDVSSLKGATETLEATVSELEEITTTEDSETTTTETVLTLADGFIAKTGQVYTGGTYDGFGYTVDAIPVLPNDEIRIYNGSGTEQSSIRVLIAYNGSTIKSSDDNVSLPYTVPSDVDGIRISAANALKVAGVKLKITRVVTQKVPVLLSRVSVLETEIGNAVEKTGTDQVTADNTAIVDKITSDNLLDISACVNGSAMKKDGTIISAGFYLSDYIPVTPGKPYIFTDSLNEAAQSYGVIRYLACFDENKSVISASGSDTAITKVFVIDEGVAYIRISFANGSQFTNHMLTQNKYVTEYQPYGVYKRTINGQYIPQFDEIENGIKQLTSGIYDRVGNIRTTAFNSTTLPDGWSNSGFTLSASGATPSAEGDLLQYEQYSDLDSSCVTVTIDAASAFDLFVVRYRRQYSAQGGRVIEFNMANKTINVYIPTVANETPTAIAETFSIPFDFVAGQYVLTISNCAELEKYTILGAGECASFYIDGRKMDRLYVGNSYTEAWSRPHDNYGVRHKSGNYTVKQISFSCPLAYEPDVLVVGDSVTEGDTIRKLSGGGFENRWAGLLSKVTLVSIWAEGGNNSTHINTDLPILTTLFKPKKVIYAIGTNDQTYATWLQNCEAFTAAFEALGAEVIYTVPQIRTEYESSSQEQIRAYVRASGHRYIDFCTALSVDGECEENNPDYFLNDGLHPNVEGHRKMFEAVICCLPDLMMY